MDTSLDGIKRKSISKKYADNKKTKINVIPIQVNKSEITENGKYNEVNGNSKKVNVEVSKIVKDGKSVIKKRKHEITKVLKDIKKQKVGDEEYKDFLLKVDSEIENITKEMDVLISGTRSILTSNNGIESSKCEKYLKQFEDRFKKSVKLLKKINDKIDNEYGGVTKLLKSNKLLEESVISFYQTSLDDINRLRDLNYISYRPFLSFQDNGSNKIESDSLATSKIDGDGEILRNNLKGSIYHQETGKPVKVSADIFAIYKYNAPLTVSSFFSKKKRRTSKTKTKLKN